MIDRCQNTQDIAAYGAVYAQTGQGAHADLCFA